MPAILDRLFRKVAQRKNERRTGRETSLKQYIVLMGEDELGISNVDLDSDDLAKLIEEHGLTQDDLRKNIDAFKEAVGRNKLAMQVDVFHQAAIEAEQTYNDLDLAEGRRRKRAVEHLQQLERQAHLAQQRSEQAMAAKSDLVANSETTTAERELSAERAEVNAEIARLRVAVNPGFHSTDNSGHSIGLGGDWAAINLYPALLAEQTRRALADENVGRSNERIAQLKSQLAAAERAVAECEKELTRLEKRAAEINEKLMKLNAAKLLPENFRLVRVKPTRDEQRKQHAREMGFYAEK